MSKPILLALLVLSALAFGVGFFENFRVNKIDFIIRDNETNNMAGLTETELAEDLEACGAEVIPSRAEWNVNYDGWMINRTWNFKFTAPGSRRH